MSSVLARARYASGYSSNTTATPASPCASPSARNCVANVVLPLPAGPVISTASPAGYPPPIIASSPGTPVPSRPWRRGRRQPQNPVGHRENRVLQLGLHVLADQERRPFPRRQMEREPLHKLLEPHRLRRVAPGPLHPERAERID